MSNPNAYSILLSFISTAQRTDCDKLAYVRDYKPFASDEFPEVIEVRSSRIFVSGDTEEEAKREFVSQFTNIVGSKKFMVRSMPNIRPESRNGLQPDWYAITMDLLLFPEGAASAVVGGR